MTYSMPIRIFHCGLRAAVNTLPPELRKIFWTDGNASCANNDV